MYQTSYPGASPSGRRLLLACAARIRKFHLLILMLACLQVSAMAYSQKVTLKSKQISLNEAIRSFKKQTGLFFVYDLNLILRQKPIQLDLVQVPLEEAMNACLQNTALEFEIIDNTVVIRARRKAANLAEVQNIELRGKVTDENGKPLEGVTVAVKGTTRAAVTNGQGAFVITGAPENGVLVVSSIGFERREIKINGKSDFGTISLLTAVEKINEVVVTTGLFKRPVENFTGVATSVSGDQMRQVNTMNVFDAVKVFDPAMRIPDNMQFGSNPNRLPQVTLRGTNNFPVQGAANGIPASGADFMSAYQTNPSMPLFILDGFEVSLQKIYDLDINRIERMTILKDAVATSAYGSRAANGVIVVDTKQPLPGKLTVNYTSNVQITAPDLTSYRLLDAAGKLEVERLSGYYLSENAAHQYHWDKLYNKRLGDIESGVNTYWLAKPLQTGVGTRQSLYVEGGDQYLRYGVNFSYLNNKGVMIGSGRNRADESPYGTFSAYTRLNPYWNPYDENGNPVKLLDILTRPGYAGETRVGNPLYDATLGTTEYAKYFGMVNNTFLEWRLRSGFRLTGKLGVTSQSDQSDKFLPADHSAFVNLTDYGSADYYTRGQYNRGNSQFFALDGSLLLDYNKTIGKGMFYATLGGSLAEQRSKGAAFVVRGFPNKRLDEVFLGNAYLRDSRPTGKNDITRRVSAFSSLNYTYDRRYMMDFSFNMDGSTQFGSDRRFAPFWALGLGWNLHEEAFMSGLRNTAIDRLKLRAGIGTTGSQQFSPFMATTTYQYATGRDYLGMLGSSLMAYGNPMLGWQQTYKRNVGMDVSLFKERVQIRLDGYLETTNDLLLDVNMPPSSGVATYKENAGKLENRGLEGNLNLFIIRRERQSIFWSVFVNAIHNRNRIKEISNSLKKMNDNNDKVDDNLQTRPQLRFEEGESVNAIWAVRSGGIDPSNGRELFYTRDGKLTYVWSAADKVIVGDALPDVSGNMGTNLNWKGLQLGVYMSYETGGKMYNQTLADRIENASILYNVDERVLFGRWKKPGDQTYFKGLADIDGRTVTEITNATTRFLQRNNFIEFESISLGYTLPDKTASKLRMKNTRISLQANNLFRFSSIEIERGLDYPFARNFTININTTF
ncbi:SusC/RagA family TonB-linked outer membrane protein [Chitinophaga sp.]|uniref:SusC/RagA family TonB-linked outer membrane protein n=1 Tax=Chitinophaga sp. TaxID=1869181 RepID=UPI002FDD68E3